MVLVALVWISSTLQGDPADEKHDSDTETEKAEMKESARQAAARQIVDSKPSPQAFHTILAEVSSQASNLNSEKFGKIVDRTTGLDDKQKEAMKASFKTIEAEAKGKEGIQPGQEYLRVMTGALKDVIPVVPPQPNSQTAGADPNLGAGQPGQPGQPGDPKNAAKDPAKAIEEAIAKLQDKNGQGGDPRKAASEAALRELLDQKNQNQGNKEGGGGGAGGGDKGGGGPPPTDTGNNKPSDNASNAAKDLHDLLKKDRDQGRRNVSRRNNDDDSKKKEEERKPQISTTAKETSTSDLSEILNKKKKDEKKETPPTPPVDQDAFGGLAGTATGTQGGKMKLLGPKSSMAPIQGGFAFNPPGGFGGFGGDAGSPLGGGLAGAKVNPPPGGGGGMDLGSMKLGDEGYYPGGGGPMAQFSKGAGIYADGGGTGAGEGGSDSDGIPEADVMNAANKSKAYSYTASSQIFSPQKQARPGNILDKNVGNMFSNVCTGQAALGVGICSQKINRVKRIENLSTAPLKKLDDQV